MTKTTNNTTERPGFDTGRWLVYGAAAFQAYHMGRAFHVYDPDGWHWMNVNFGGLILGAILNVIIAQTAVRLPTIAATFASLKELMPKASKKADKKEAQARSRALKKMTMAMKQNIYSQVGFYILLFFSALMVGPALFILWTATMPFHPIFIGIMAAAGAVAPDVAITVGGFAASDTPANAERRSATKSATVSDAVQGASKRSKQGEQDSRLPASKGSNLHPQGASKDDNLHPQGSKQPLQDAELLAYWQSNPQASDQQVATQFGRSRQGIQQRREKLVKSGDIRMTKDGVEIIGIPVSSQPVGGER
jgi:hypothetical protein